MLSQELSPPHCGDDERASPRQRIGSTRIGLLVCDYSMQKDGHDKKGAVAYWSLALPEEPSCIMPANDACIVDLQRRHPNFPAYK